MLSSSRFLKVLLCTFAAFAVSGCQSNPWSDFYQSEIKLPENAPYSGRPQCIPVRDFDSSVLDYLRSDYVVIGHSQFNAGSNVSLESLRTFGDTIKSDVILYAVGNATHTQSAMVVPHFTPGRQQTTYISGYGSNGSSFYGTANTYSSGTYSSSVVPVTIVRQDYGALFLKKNWMPVILGVIPRPLTPAEAASAGTNGGLRVHLVIRNSPAFDANIFEGDIVLEAAGQTPHDFWIGLENWAGKTVKLVILRDGKKIEKSLSLNGS